MTLLLQLQIEIDAAGVRIQRAGWRTRRTAGDPPGIVVTNDALPAIAAELLATIDPPDVDAASTPFPSVGFRPEGATPPATEPPAIALGPVDLRQFGINETSAAELVARHGSGRVQEVADWIRRRPSPPNNPAALLRSVLTKSNQ